LDLYNINKKSGATPYRKMAYEYNNSEGSLSKFNAGMLQMTRLHSLQEKINGCNLNPLAYDSDASVFNFEIIFSCNNSLLEEAWPKLSEKEQKKAILLKTALNNFLKKYPIYEKRRRKGLQLNECHWEIISEWLCKYSLMIRDLLNKHRLSSPDDDDDDGL